MISIPVWNRVPGTYISLGKVVSPKRKSIRSHVQIDAAKLIKVSWQIVGLGPGNERDR